MRVLLCKVFSRRVSAAVSVACPSILCSGVLHFSPVLLLLQWRPKESSFAIRRAVVVLLIWPADFCSCSVCGGCRSWEGLTLVRLLNAVRLLCLSVNGCVMPLPC